MAKPPRKAAKAPSKKVIKSKPKYQKRMDKNYVDRVMEGKNRMETLQPHKSKYRPYPKQRKKAQKLQQQAQAHQIAE